MSEKQAFSVADLQVGRMGHVSKKGDVFTHTHTITFGRPLTQAERHLFRAVLNGFYYTVHFSRQFGDGLVALPVVEFETPNQVCYTLKQTTLSGPWKDLLFAILANFSYEIVPIRRHDDSQTFDPERVGARQEI